MGDTIETSWEALSVTGSGHAYVGVSCADPVRGVIGVLAYDPRLGRGSVSAMAGNHAI
ncbi:hypothetical protein [Mycobacterium spongiae]|uniref:Uncharacterized protein n=1 Tax=Mycobacterium spongiae TaxID=886343 RepID=A0A975PW04_9MYCO|nr:hypothetical protein [Mycobacterium spongiae]QUR66163.1 hypothetical protein F6B93_02865 [Mycobacterium spongiae]